MATSILEFTVSGPAAAVASAIEQCAVERRIVSALVVPWESGDGRLSMAVTTTKGQGWAIEHTNLGTITIEETDDGRTRVTVLALAPTPPSDPARPGRTTDLLADFARRIQQRCTGAATATGPGR